MVLNKQILMSNFHPFEAVDLQMKKCSVSNKQILMSNFHLLEAVGRGSDFV